MNSDFDNDFDFNVQGRRENQSSRRRNQEPDDSLDDILDSAFPSSNKPKPVPRKNSNETGRKKSLEPETPNVDPPQSVNGWGDSNTRQPRRRDAGAGSMDFGDDLFSAPIKKVNGVNQREFNSYNEEEKEIPEIPVLDENEGEVVEDMAFQVAEAPDVQVHQISTYKELDKEFFREKAFQFLEGNIDVSLLHCGLNTENQIAEEEDVIWEWTKLFTEVVSVLSVGYEQQAEPEETSLTTVNDERSRRKADVLAKVSSSKKENFFF